MEETAVQLEETPPTVKMPRVKNPNKVKAGLASAAKRRQKEEDFLALLEEHKQKIHDELSARQQEETSGPQTVTKGSTLHAPWDLWGGDWTPWIFGGLGLAVVGYISLRGRLQDIYTTSRGKPQSVQAAAKPQPPTAPDPFYME